MLPFYFSALKMTATNIWQIVAAPLLEQKKNERQILDLEIKTLEDQVKMLRLRLENNDDDVIVDDYITDDLLTDDESDDLITYQLA